MKTFTLFSLPRHLLLALALLTLSTASVAQTSTSLASPYDALSTHLENLEPDHYNPTLAARAFGTVDDETKQLAVELKQIIDGRGLKVNFNRVPRDPSELDSAKQIRYAPFPTKLPEVYLEKRGGRWTYSPATIDQISALHNKVYPLGSQWLLHWLPMMGTHELLGLRIWQWLSALLLLVFGALVFLVVRLSMRGIIHLAKIARFGVDSERTKIMQRTEVQTGYVLGLQVVMMYIPVLQLPSLGTYVLLQSIAVLQTLVGIFLIVSLIDLFLVFIHRIGKVGDLSLDDFIIPIIGNVVKVLLITAALLRILYLLDVNVTALIAGVSIGGLAIALAAQDTVKNLIGSIMIFADRPFQIGDYVKAADVEGTIEEVGFRSTRVRTLDTSVISVPNGKIADLTINNLGVRTFRRFKTDILIDNTAAAAELAAYKIALEDILRTHPKIRENSCTVTLTALGVGTFTFTLQMLISTNSVVEEQIVKHEILLQTVRTAEQVGVTMARAYK